MALLARLDAALGRPTAKPETPAPARETGTKDAGTPEAARNASIAPS